MISRRQAVGALGVLGAGAALGALSWRRQPAPAVTGSGSCPGLGGGQIRWIVPHAAGGGYDAESRLVAPYLARRLQRVITILNLPGAGGLQGARAIATASPDGRTLGLLGMPGLLAAGLTGETQAPDPAAFEVLGRVSRSWHVWVTGRDSPWQTFDAVLARSRERNLVFALSEVASVNFLSIGVTAGLLDVGIDMVPGFAGSKAAVLAAIRGDVDLVCFDFEVVRDGLESGELRAVLQVSDRPVAPHPTLNGVPTLAGISAGRETTALIELIGAGRVVVAPRGLDPALAACLDNSLATALADDGLRQAATRSLDAATGARARADILAASRDLPILQPHVRALLAKVRG